MQNQQPISEDSADCITKVLRFSVTMAAPPTKANLNDSPPPNAGGEVVMVVDNELKVRKVTGVLLKASGYKVLEADGAAEALRIAATHPGAIDLVISDVVMPGMDGEQLALQLAEVRPTTKVLFISGYMDDCLLRHGISRSQRAFLQKPYARSELADKVREVLDASPARPS